MLFEIVGEIDVLQHNPLVMMGEPPSFINMLYEILENVLLEIEIEVIFGADAGIIFVIIELLELFPATAVT